MECPAVWTIGCHFYRLLQGDSNPFSRGMLTNTVTNDFPIEQVEIWIKICFLDDGTPLCIYFIILEFCGIRRNLLVRNAGVETTVQAVRGNLPDLSLVGIISPASVCEGFDL